MSKKLIVIALICAMASLAFGQGGNFGIEFGFVKQNTHQSLEEVSTNVLRIVNNTRSKQSLTLDIAAPDGWQLFTKLDRVYEVLPRDSAFIPVRIIPLKASKGNTNYIINGFLFSEDGFQLANDYWYVNIKQFSMWEVSLPERKVYFVNEKNDARFEVMVENTGNSDENITVDLAPSRNLTVTDTSGMPVELSATFHLLSKTDTMLYYRVLKVEEKRTGNMYEDGYHEEPLKKYSVKVSAMNDGGDAGKPKLWRGNVDFYELNHQMQIEGFGYSELPITIDLNTYDILDNTTLTLDIYGTANFNNDRSLSYRYQSNYVDNFFDPERYLGDYHYLGYFSNRGSIELGNLSGGKHGAFIGGKGLKGSLRLKHDAFSAMFVRNPSLFREANMWGVSANNMYTGKKINNDTYFQWKDDDALQVTSGILSTSSNFQITRSHMVKLALGGSREEHYSNVTAPLSLLGFGYGISYGGSIKKFHLSASNRFGSKDYSGLRGVLSIAASAGYDFSKKYSLSFLYDHYRQEPNVYAGGVLLPDPPKSNRERYEARFSIATERAKFILRPYYLKQEAITLRTATKAVGFDYRPASEGDLRFYSSFEGGFVKALDEPTLKDFFIAQVFANFKYRSFSTSIRYYYGPYQTIDQVRFIQTRENPQKVAFSAYFDYWMLHSQLQLKTNTNLHYETLFKRVGFVLRPELAYYTKNNFTFSFYMEYVLTAAKSANHNAGAVELSDKSNVVNDINIGAGIKKSFGIPLSRKKFHDVEIIVFKDVNGNGIMDNSEKPVENMLINVRTAQLEDADSAAGTQIRQDKILNYELLSDAKGSVSFGNLPTGFYTIRVKPLVETGGWFDTKEVQQLIDSREKVYIPLNKAARITGNIVLQRDKYSKFEGTIDLSRIRVTSTNSAGNTASTLTGKNGEFSMFLPVGEYTIDINNSALGGSFEFVNNSVKILLSDPNNNYSVTFYVREKKRQMNVKEFKQENK